MLEKPNLSDEKLISCLQDAYGIPVTGLEFLPIGNASGTWVYRVRAEDGQAFFLKLKTDPIYEPAVAVPHYLRDQGIEQVVAPLATISHELWQRLEDFTLMLYPFIAGKTGMEIGLTDSQWRELGAVLKRIHTTALPPALASRVETETFVPKWSVLVKPMASKIPQYMKSRDPSEKALAEFWNQRQAEITKIVDRAEELGSLLREQSPEFVLCHTDIHTANILIDEAAKMHIVDWDSPLYAPKERDLMFVVEPPVNGEFVLSREQRLFSEGYGMNSTSDPAPLSPRLRGGKGPGDRGAVNLLALAYYRYEWVVQEIGDCGERVFLMHNIGEESKKDALRAFQALFEAGDVVEMAYRADRAWSGS